MDTLIHQITDFIRSIGIEVYFRPLGENGFLPGIPIKDGLWYPTKSDVSAREDTESNFRWAPTFP